MALKLRWTSRVYSAPTLSRSFKYILKSETDPGLTKTQAGETARWLAYFGLIDRKRAPTELGKTVAAFDPYFEEYTTLLIFQLGLVKHETLWGYLFRDYKDNEIERSYFIGKCFGDDTALNPASIEKDFPVLINTYLEKKNAPEEPGSVLAPLRLIRKSRARGLYYKKAADTSVFNAPLVLAFLSDLRSEEDLDTVAGRFKTAFNMDTGDVLDLLAMCPDVRRTSRAGINRVMLPESLDFLECVKESYKKL